MANAMRYRKRERGTREPAVSYVVFIPVATVVADAPWVAVLAHGSVAVPGTGGLIGTGA
jgi:hypothetical protein